MKTIIVITLCTLLLSCQKDLEVLQQNTETSSKTLAKETANNKETSDIIDISGVLFNPCTNEDMQVTGYIEIRYHATLAGLKLNEGYTFNYSKVSAVGVTSGLTYNVNGFSANSGQRVYTDEDLQNYEITRSISNNRLTFSLDGSKLQTIFKYHFVNGTESIVLEDGVCN